MSKQHPYGPMTDILKAEIDKIRPLYQLPIEIEAELFRHGCSTSQLSVRYRIPLHELEWLRREDCSVPYEGKE